MEIGRSVIQVATVGSASGVLFYSGIEGDFYARPRKKLQRSASSDFSPLTLIREISAKRNATLSTIRLQKTASSLNVHRYTESLQPTAHLLVTSKNASHDCTGRFCKECFDFYRSNTKQN